MTPGAGSHSGQGFDSGATAGGSRGVKAGGAHRQHLDGIRGLHGGDGVAGVNGALKGVGADDLGDVRHLAHIQLGRHAGGDVFAGCSGGEHDVAVVASDGQHLGSHVLSQAMGQASFVGVDHFGHTSDLRSGGGGGTGIATSHQHMHVTTALGSSGHGVQGGALDGGVVVFSDYESSHDQITFATFFSLSTSVATSGTLIPALRLAGSATLRVLMRGATFTPRSSGLKMSSCFFLAFMMLGKVT